MSNPIASLITAAANAGGWPKKFGSRENKLAESVKAYVDGAAPATNNIVAASTFTCTATGTTQTITAPCVATDVVLVNVKSNSSGTLFVHKAAAGAGSISVNLSSSAAIGDVLQYCVIRAK